MPAVVVAVASVAPLVSFAHFLELLPSLLLLLSLCVHDENSTFKKKKN